jgi:hypothetical protein
MANSPTLVFLTYLSITFFTIKMKRMQCSPILLFVLLLVMPAMLKAQEDSVRVDQAVAKPTRTPHFSIGVLGGLDRNYHIVDMSYMNDYSYSPYAPGRTYGV